jgi:hypothetical protein
VVASAPPSAAAPATEETEEERAKRLQEEDEWMLQFSRDDPDAHTEVYSEPAERARKAKETKDRYDFTCLTVEEVARSYQVRLASCVFFLAGLALCVVGCGWVDCVGVVGLVGLQVRVLAGLRFVLVFLCVLDVWVWFGWWACFGLHESAWGDETGREGPFSS